MSNEMKKCYTCGDTSTETNIVELGPEAGELCHKCIIRIGSAVVDLIEELHQETEAREKKQSNE